MQSLKIVELDNNHFSGALDNQFDQMVGYQVDEIQSRVWLQGNSFSGELPLVVKNVTLGEPCAIRGARLRQEPGPALTPSPAAARREGNAAPGAAR